MDRCDRPTRFGASFPSGEFCHEEMVGYSDLSDLSVFSDLGVFSDFG